MDEGALPGFILVPISSSDQERFAIAETNGMLLHFTRSFAQTSTTEELPWPHISTPCQR